MGGQDGDGVFCLLTVRRKNATKWRALSLGSGIEVLFGGEECGVRPM